MKRFSTLAFRNLKARFVRTILTTAGIILGVGVILAISITNESTIISIRSMFEEAAGKADLMIEPASEREKGFDRSVLEHVRRTEGVLIAAPATYAETVLAGQSAVEGKEVGLMVYGIDPAVDQKVRFYKVVEGDSFPRTANTTSYSSPNSPESTTSSLERAWRYSQPKGLSPLPSLGWWLRRGRGGCTEGQWLPSQ